MRFSLRVAALCGQDGPSTLTLTSSNGGRETLRRVCPSLSTSTRALSPLLGNINIIVAIIIITSVIIIIIIVDQFHQHQHQQSTPRVLRSKLPEVENRRTSGLPVQVVDYLNMDNS